MKHVPRPSALRRSRGRGQSLVSWTRCCFKARFWIFLQPYRERVAVFIFEFGTFRESSTIADAGEFVQELDPFLASLPRASAMRLKSATRSFFRPNISLACAAMASRTCSMPGRGCPRFGSRCSSRRSSRRISRWRGPCSAGPALRRGSCEIRAVPTRYRIPIRRPARRFDTDRPGAQAARAILYIREQPAGRQCARNNRSDNGLDRIRGLAVFGAG